MRRSVQMRTGMFSGFKGVPIPRWTALVVAGKLPHAECRRVGPWRRQDQKGRLRTQRLRQVNKGQTSGTQFGKQLL